MELMFVCELLCLKCTALQKLLIHTNTSTGVKRLHKLNISTITGIVLSIYYNITVNKYPSSTRKDFPTIIQHGRPYRASEITGPNVKPSTNTSTSCRKLTAQYVLLDTRLNLLYSVKNDRDGW